MPSQLRYFAFRLLKLLDVEVVHRRVVRGHRIDALITELLVQMDRRFKRGMCLQVEALVAELAGTILDERHEACTQATALGGV